MFRIKGSHSEERGGNYSRDKNKGLEGKGLEKVVSCGSQSEPYSKLCSRQTFLSPFLFTKTSLEFSTIE